MGYSAERFTTLFEKDVYPEAERGSRLREWSTLLGHQAVALYTTKRIVSGDYMEYECFPVWASRQETTRAKKVNPTEAAQRAQNEKDARKKMVRMTNANFTSEDLFLTLTYEGPEPTTIEEARRDMQAFIRRVRRRREKLGLPELKYIYTIEYLGTDGRKKRVHHHIVMSGMDRDEVERIWEKGRANANRLQPDEYGYEGLARYIVKSKGRPSGEKQFCYSRNLKKPKVTYSDRRLSKRNVVRLIGEEDRIRELIERREPGYVVNDMKVKRSDWVAGAYVTVRLRRVAPRGSPPGKKKKDRKT